MLTRYLSLAAALSLLAGAAAAADSATPAPLKAVGVLGNSSGFTDSPVPYAFYTGIAADARGRLYLAGADDGVPVCDQDGHCLAVLRIPQAERARSVRSVMVRAGDRIFCVAQHVGGNSSALYRIDTRAEDAAKLTMTRIAAGPGAWAVSPTLDAAGRVIVGQSLADTRSYRVMVVAPDADSDMAPDGAPAAMEGPPQLFSVALPQGATRPWKHEIQVEPDGSISIIHLGGVNWGGRFSPKGERLGEARDGQIIDGFRYHFGYDGGVRRMDLTDTKTMPGDCGSGAGEIRMAGQMVHVGERYFFAGRGGAVEAKWNGTNFEYTRRIGGVFVEELANDGQMLRGIAFTAAGNNDVQHWLNLPKAYPVAQLLPVTGPVHSKRLAALVPAPEGIIGVYRAGGGIRVFYDGARHLEFDLALPEVQDVGQLAVLGQDLLLADPKSGRIWRRPLMDKQAPVTPWRGIDGVTGLAVAGDAIFAATSTRVLRLAAAGKAVIAWETPADWKGIRRLAATPEFVYVCDTGASVVDQLDAATGATVARLGVAGEPGATLQRLDHPWAVAADANGVYIADSGNGRIVIATTSLWRPDIRPLPREDNSSIVAAAIPLKPPAAGRMSVNVYDANDVTVRQLVCAVPSASEVTWDGKDQYGRWAAPGTYRYHGAIAPKLSLRYVTSIGQSGTPPYRTADGKGSWGGVWGNVMDICPVTAEPGSDIVVLWAFEEGEGGLIRMSQDGEVRWKQHLDWWMKAQQMAVASDGKYVYITGASAMNAPEGQENYGGAWNRPLLWRVDAATGAKKLYSTDQAQQPMFGEYRKEGRIVTDLAEHDGKLYLTSPALGTLFVIDAATAKQLAAWPVPDVSGVAFDSTGRLLAGSGDQVLELDPASGAVKRTLAAAGGQVWDVDATGDGGFVVSVGAPRNQVVYFDAAGKETRAVGSRGGRPRVGKMQPTSFLNPVGLCVTGNGKLFVAENATPKRFTRWSPAGELEREFQGPYYLSGMFGIDEDAPENVYGDTHSDLIRYTVDYDTGKWAVDRYWIGAYEQSGVPAKWWPRIRHRDGKTYWCSGSGAIVELADDRARGVAAVYGGYVKKLADGTYEPRYHVEKTGLMGTWSDLNGDGQKQPDEWQVTDKPAYPLTGGGPQQGWGSYFDEQFDLYMHDWSDNAPGGVWRIPVAEWKNGTPIYRWDQAQHAGLPRLGVPSLAHGSPGARTAFAHQGAVYAFNGGYNAAGLPGVGHGHDWEFAQITKYDGVTGKPLWHAGERCPGFAAPGQHYCPTGAAGVIRDYLFWTDENSLVHVWDVAHGLYVDTLLEDTMRGPEPSPYTVWVELFNTRVFRHPKTGKVYLMAASDAIHVFEVLGTEQKLQRFDGEFTLTAAGLEQAQQKEQARAAPAGRSLTVRRTPAPVKLDGDAAAFAGVTPVTLALTATAQAEIRLLYDDAALYVDCDVRDDSPWRNAGGDATALFKTGDEVSVWLGPSAAKRAAGLGDVRFLFAPGPDGKVKVVEYRAKVKEGARPATFRSPSGQLTLDQVRETQAVPATVTVTEKGYRLRAAIPWSASGLAPTAERFALDVSVNFSDPAGQRNVARLHWGRNGGAMVYDLPSEARLEPETWGTAVLGK